MIAVEIKSYLHNLFLAPGMIHQLGFFWDVTMCIYNGGLRFAALEPRVFRKKFLCLCKVGVRSGDYIECVVVVAGKYTQ